MLLPERGERIIPPLPQQAPMPENRHHVPLPAKKAALTGDPATGEPTRSLESRIDRAEFATATKALVGDYAAKGNLDMAALHARVLIEYETRDMSIPGRALPGMLQELKALQPDDQAFHDRLDAEGLERLQVWAEIGRDEDVFGPMYAAKTPDEWQRNAVHQFETLARTKSSTPFVEAHANLLRRYPPTTDLQYREAIDRAERFFLQERPATLAAEIRQAFVAKPQSFLGIRSDPNALNLRSGLKTMQDALDPQKVDPLTAALTFNRLDDVIPRIPEAWSKSFDVVRPSGEWSVPAQVQIDQLAAAVDSAARSPESSALIDKLAQGFAEHPQPWRIQDSRDRVLGFAEVDPFRHPTLPLAIAAAFNGKGEREIADKLVRSVAGDTQRLVRDTHNAMADLLLELKKYDQPDRRWGSDSLTPEQRAKGQKHLHQLLRQPAAEEKALALHKEVDRRAYELLRAEQAIKRYESQLTGLPSSDLLQRMSKAGEDDPVIEQALMTSRMSLHESLRAVHAAGLEQGAGYDSLLLHDAVDGSGSDRAGKAIAYATMGIVPSFAILKSVTGGSSGQVLALLPEQFIRDATNLGLLDGLVGDGYGAPIGGLVKTAVGTGLIVGTTKLHNLAIPKIGARLGWDPKDISKAKIGSLMWARLAIGPLYRLLEGGIDRFYPKPPTGPDGKPFYAGPAEWAFYEGPKGAALASSVAAVVMPYKTVTHGWKELNAAGGGAWPKPRDLKDNFGKVWREGWKEGWSSSAKAFKLVMRQWAMAQALSNKPEAHGFPRLNNAWQDSYGGQAIFAGTMLAQLVESLSPKDLAKMARKVPVPWVSVAADGASKMAAGRRLMNGAKQTAKGANPVGWGLFGGVMFMETYDHYQMVQQFRKPTQDYLEAATGDKELAKNLSMIDGYGHGTDARLRALAAYRGVSPRETFDWFADVQKKNPAFAGSFASHLIRDLHPRRPKVGEELTPDDFVWDDPSDARHIPLDMRIWGPGTLEAFSSYADRRGFPLPRRVY